MPKGDVITVRQILDHTSGLYDYAHEPHLSTNRRRGTARFRSYQPRELLDVAFGHPSNFEPGTDWRYSNTNYVVAGLLIEQSPVGPMARRSPDASSNPWACGTPACPATGRDCPVRTPAATSRSTDAWSTPPS
ncbi:hypothetical protein GCM10022243_52610 [Saccharothrix violaceirubra]|uniref:Beta-lactamase-related domain-containing protein n=1 Tax=Saccharothrix violaceirubra TaxID=413306 RepID=A0A7W7SYJ8_9PSEU|nr:serine hydrolase domain-containing protein [Saccharothrix violaceirubra]MBB4963322.1 hypothetical protein [Saccharothrix violaceirubra]